MSLVNEVIVLKYYIKNYNEQGLLTDKADSTSNHTQMNYNARGLTEQTVDRNGTSATYTYDERGQQTTATLKASSTNTLASGTMQVKSIYGSGGNILTDRHKLYINDAKVATQTSTSDKLDRITSLSSSATDYAARLDASYDPLDRINSQTSTLNGTSFLTNYGYDKSRLTQIQTNGAQARTTAATANVNYAYTPSGQVQQITFPTLSDGTTLQENMTYDPMNRLTRVSNTKGDSTLSVYSYQYDNNGNITSVTEQVKDGTPQTSTYSYDKLSRLTGVKRADATETAYSYDLRGNRLTQKDTRDLPDEKATNYRYDLQNTLISVTKDSVKTVLEYLPDGLRWKKTNGSKVTQYSYNGADQVIGDQTSNGTISSYIRGDRVLVKKDLTNQKDYYYLYNGHGDVVQMVGTDGSLVNSYQYDEWGNLTNQKETVANEFKYAGETYDSETGLYYLKARYYDPNIGRFLNEDTVEGEVNNPLSLNIYVYVHNNPLVYIDPSGNMPVWSLNLIAATYAKSKPADWEASLMVFGANGVLGDTKHYSLFTPFHEIAQINIAKVIYDKTGALPELEKKIPTGETEFFGLKKKTYEADIVSGDKVWEVKPLNGQDPKPQLELYKKIGGLTEGEKLPTISGITVFDDIKMRISFPEMGEARYSLYQQGSDGTVKSLTTVGAAFAVLKGLAKMTPAGKRFSPAY